MGYGGYRYVNVLRCHAIDFKGIGDEVAVDSRIGSAVADIERIEISHIDGRGGQAGIIYLVLVLDRRFEKRQQLAHRKYQRDSHESQGHRPICCCSRCPEARSVAGEVSQCELQ